MNITDITEKKLEATNRVLIPMYQEIEVLEMELAIKKAKMHSKEVELLGSKEAAKRRLLRQALDCGN